MFEPLYPYLVIDPATITFFVDVCIAIALGFIIGVEREARRKDAGISTNSFVILRYR